MANTDAQALDQRDADFAARLAKRDESVLLEIDGAYAAALRKLLKPFRGKWLSDEDIDEILSDSLKAVWDDFSQSGGATVRWFYFSIGKRRYLDVMRKASCRERLHAKISAAVVGAGWDQCTPLVLNEKVEAENAVNHMLRLINDAAQHLTPRQRIAFESRFLVGDNQDWAKNLSLQSGIPAQRWRKASDEARKSVAKYLKDHGVRYSEEGGHYEVAKTRNYA